MILCYTVAGLRRHCSCSFLIFIADTMNACIKVVNSNNEMIVYAGKNNNPGYSGDGQEAILSQLLYPTNVKRTQFLS